MRTTNTSAQNASGRNATNSDEEGKQKTGDVVELVEKLGRAIL